MSSNQPPRKASLQQQQLYSKVPGQNAAVAAKMIGGAQPLRGKPPS